MENVEELLQQHFLQLIDSIVYLWYGREFLKAAASIKDAFI